MILQQNDKQLDKNYAWGIIEPFPACNAPAVGEGSQEE